MLPLECSNWFRACSERDVDERVIVTAIGGGRKAAVARRRGAAHRAQLSDVILERTSHNQHNEKLFNVDDCVPQSKILWYYKSCHVKVVDHATFSYSIGFGDKLHFSMFSKYSAAFYTYLA